MVLKKDYKLNDRYRILDVLGQGGMGSVYRAIDENLGMEVAVKENAFTSEEYSRQFRREATILANMRHPNLPRVSDHFEIEGQGQYLVMDYIEGEDLRQRMDRLGVLEEDEVIIIGAAICDALDYLHTRKPPVLHRDIKPGNIKINPDGVVYLVDFGLAKLVEGSRATTTGARAMTPGYSSPEQYGTARTDERSDLYSVSATLYAALTNTIPEDGLARAMEQADLTPVRKRNPKVSRRLAQVLEKALEVHPKDRYQTADEFKRALLQAGTDTRAIQHTEEMTVPPPPPEVIEEVAKGLRRDSTGATEPDIKGESISRIRRRRRKIRRRLLLSIYILLLGAWGVWYGQGMPGREALSTVLPFIASQDTPTLTPSPEAAATSSPTGEPTATVTSRPTSTRTSTPADTLTPAPNGDQTPTAALSSPTLQPTAVTVFDDQEQPSDEEVLAFVSTRSGSMQIWLYTFADESYQQLTDAEEGACQPAWSPDGAQLVYTSPCRSDEIVYTDTSLYLLDLESGQSTPLDVPEGSFNPAWSPDGNWLVFSQADSLSLSSLYRYDFATQQISLMTQGKLNYHPAWSPDGERIVFVSTRQNSFNLFVMPNQPGAAVELFTRSGDNRNYDPSWSIQGDIVFSQSPQGGFVSLVRASAELIGAPAGAYADSRVNANPEILPESSPDFSPSGNWIAYESWPTGGNHDIYLLRLDGQVNFRLTTSSALDFDPAWKPR